MSDYSMALADGAGSGGLMEEIDLNDQGVEMIDQSENGPSDLNNDDDATEAAPVDASHPPRIFSVPTRFRPVLVFMLCQGLCLGISLVMTPALFLVLSSNNNAQSAYYVGLANGLASSLQFLSNPLFGSLSDRHGRKPFLMVSILAWFGLCTAIGSSPSYATLVIGTVFRGLDCGITMATTIISDVTSKPLFIHLNGKVMAALAGGLLVGPLLAAALSQADRFHFPYLFGSFLMLISLFTVHRYFTETRVLSANPTQSFSIRLLNPFLPLKTLAVSKPVFLLSLCIFLTNFALTGISTVFYLFNHEKFGWGPTENGAFLFAFALLSILGQVFILPLLHQPNSILYRYNIEESGLLAIGMVAGVIQLTGFILTPSSMGGLYFMSLVIGFPGFIISSVLRGTISKIAPLSVQGQLQGSLGSLNALAAIIAPLLFSSMFGYFVRSRYDPTATTPYFPEAAYTMALASKFVMAALLTFTYKRYLLTPEYRGLMKNIVPHSRPASDEQSEATGPAELYERQEAAAPSVIPNETDVNESLLK